MALGENEIAGAGVIDLESYKGQTDAPFEVVAKGEEPAEYTPRFSAILKSNWDNVCKMMEWKKDGVSVDWNLFKVSSNPFQVVVSIQEKLIAEGGELPRYGVDGKFGPETEAALKFVMDKKEKAADTGAVEAELSADLVKPEPAVDEQPVAPTVKPVAVASEEVAAPVVAPARVEAPALIAVEDVVQEEVEKPAVRSARDQFFRDNLRETIAVMPQIEARLKAADLVVDKAKLENPDLKGAYIAAFKDRAAKLREKLILEEPRLKVFGVVVAEIIPFVEAKIKEIDFSKINTQADLLAVLKSLVGELEVKLEILKSNFSKEDLEMLDSALTYKDVDRETLMTFFMASINELSVSVFEPLEANSEKFALLLKTFTDENIVDGGANQVRRVSADLDQKSWSELVKRGIVASGEVNFEQNGRAIAFNLDDLTVSIDGKRVKLVLPAGAKLVGVEALPDGSLGLDISSGFFAGRQLISPLSLELSLNKILSTSKGGRVDVGSGAYFEV